MRLYSTVKYLSRSNPFLASDLSCAIRLLYSTSRRKYSFRNVESDIAGLLLNETSSSLAIASFSSAGAGAGAGAGAYDIGCDIF